MYAKGWETRRANAAKLGASPHEFKKRAVAKRRKPVIADALSPRAEAEAINAVRDDWANVGNQMSVSARGLPSTAPGQGEIVGGADDALTTKIMKLARKKDGDVAILALVRDARTQAAYEGRRDADHLATKRLIEVQQAIADRIVCGFIAEVEAITAMHRGLPQSLTFSVSSFNVTKIIDALNKAGYYAEGKR